MQGADSPVTGVGGDDGGVSDDVRVPPGWPAAVRPPGAPHWQRTAVAWLLDLCPAEYRGHPVLQRHPVALARLAALHVEAGVHAARRALATSRSDLSEALTPTVMAELLEAVESEEARLVAASRAVGLVEDALRGIRHVPRL